MTSKKTATKTKANKQSESLGVFWGGFLINSPVPLEIVLNRCSHNCAYCFANLAIGDRESNIQQAMNLLADLWKIDKDGRYKRKTYAAMLLREGYPVALSNRIDMLAGSNWYQARSLLELMIEMKIPVFYMTRFGRPAWTEEWFSMERRPSAIYCSVPTLNEDIARRLEPGAPLPLERLSYVRRAVEAGHTVNVGINPICPGWIDDPDALAQAIKRAGAHGVYIQKLHFSHAQVKKMSPRQREDLGDLVKAGLNYRTDKAQSELYDAVKAACQAQGLWTYNGQQGDYTEFYAPFVNSYKRTFPLMQEFVNLCHQELRSGDYIFWEDFRDWFVPQLPPGVWGLRDHLNALVIPQALYGLRIPQRMTYEKLLWYAWRHRETIISPANVDCFAWAGYCTDKTKDEWTIMVDENDNPILVFRPEGTNGHCLTENHDL